MKEYLNAIKPGEGDRFLQNKVLFAERVTPHISKDNLKGVLDLEKKISIAYGRILEWNGETPDSRP